MKKTVFILGAGSAKDYGFPISSELNDFIYSNYLRLYKIHVYPEDTYGFRDWNQLQGQEMELYLTPQKKLIESFKRIDIDMDLLASRQPDKFLDFGKRALIYSLLEFEMKTKDNLKSGWHKELFNQLTKMLITPESINDFSTDDITFITFNYDRTLEQFLYNQFMQNWPNHRDEVKDIMQKMNIIHIYGKIADLDWQVPEKDFSIPYGYNIRLTDKNLLNQVKDNIKLRHQERSPELLEYSINKIKEAETIYFFGFGFGPDNLNILNIPDCFFAANDIICTAFDMSDQEMSNIKFLFSNKKNTHHNTITEAVSCTEMLKRYPLSRYFFE